MKIVCFSSDKDFHLFAENFLKNGIDIACLITEKPKPEGRSLRQSPNKAHQYAIDNNIPTLYPDKFDDRFIKQINEIDVEIGFIFAYGKILPQSVIDLFTKGIFNIHFSLLPEYIGPSPIQQALLDNKHLTGYTIFKITNNLDCGDILDQKEITVLKDDNFDSLRLKTINKALESLADILKEYSAGGIKLRKMSDSGQSYTKKLTKNDGLLSNELTAETAYNKIRAFSHWPKTFIMIDEKRFIIHKARLINDQLIIEEIQPEGKKIMAFDDFKNGYHSLLTKFPHFVNIN